jgi:hypothetical protein
LSEGKHEKIKSKVIKRIFVESNRIYSADFIGYAALTSNEWDLFYQDPHSADWDLLIDKFSFHEFPSHTKLAKAYGNFYKYASLGNAMMSKLNADEGSFTKFIKKGAYGVYYMMMG